MGLPELLLNLCTYARTINRKIGNPGTGARENVVSIIAGEGGCIVQAVGTIRIASNVAAQTLFATTRIQYR